MGVCEPVPRPDMYGAGLRVAFYLHWSATLCLTHKAPGALPAVRVLGLGLSLGTTAALLAQTCRDAGGGGKEHEAAAAAATVDAGGIYAVVTLATGAQLLLAPAYLLQLLTRGNALAWPGRRQARGLRYGEWLLAVMTSSSAVWFFASHVPGLGRARRCHQYGFFFGRGALDGNAALLAVNTGMHALVLVVCAAEALRALCRGGRGAEAGRGGECWHRQGRLWSAAAARSINRLRLVADLAVLAVLVLAVELPLRWNGLATTGDGIGGTNTAAQLVPPLLAAGSVMLAAACAAARPVDAPSPRRAGPLAEALPRRADGRSGRRRSTAPKSPKRTQRARRHRRRR